MDSEGLITRETGIAGIIAGLGLALEFGLFVASGWTPEVFEDSTAALAFLESGETLLRAAAFVGIVNLAATVLFLVGFAGAAYLPALLGVVVFRTWGESYSYGSVGSPTPYVGRGL